MSKKLRPIAEVIRSPTRKAKGRNTDQPNGRVVKGPRDSDAEGPDLPTNTEAVAEESRR